MGRRVLGIVVALILVVAFFAYLGYHSYGPSRAGGTGAVFSSAGTRATNPVADAKKAADDDTVIVYPKQGGSSETASVTGETAQTTSSTVTANQVTQGSQAAPATAPSEDTISPNPPNGMVFAGSGRYQLYRQGNITWRLDTNTGRSCIIFATDEEWRKPRVYRAGCGKS